MAVLFVTECRGLGSSGTNVAPAPAMPPIAEKALVIGGSSTASTTFSANTYLVILNCDVTCSLAWSAGGVTTATATTSAQRMGAGETRYYSVSPGSVVAVVANS